MSGMGDPQPNPPKATHRPTKKWCWAGLYWLVQTIVVLLAPLIIDGHVIVEGDLGILIDAPTDPFYLLPVSLWAVALIGLQAIFLWPVRKPAAKSAAARGWPLRLSLAVGGLGIAAMVWALLLAGWSLLDLLGHEPTFSGWYLALPVALSWLVATPLLIAFCRKGPRESLLQRIAAWLFVGTIIEVLAIIPLDVMVRRRTNCYCDEGTYNALLVCTGVGLFALGPCICLPLLARRRKRWYEGRCDACGYDMRGSLHATHCPECGAGWRPGA
jgi:hypothetical protein